METLVRPDLERWRREKERKKRAFEKKLLGALSQISKTLSELAEGQQQIIEELKKKE